MALSLRQRILLTLAPVFVLLLGVGVTGVLLIHNLGNRANEILRENYASIDAMNRLIDAVGLVEATHPRGEPPPDLWSEIDQQFRIEQNNVTVEGEAELVGQLATALAAYRRGDHRKAGQVIAIAREIHFLNQENMYQADRNARETARRSMIGFGLGLAVAAALAVLIAWRTSRSILHSIRSVTQSAIAIGSGNLDQVLPVRSRDELGLLADAFNVMARQLRHYRQADNTRLLRAQRTSQATIDSFPDPVLVVDPEGHVEMANPAAERLLGVSSGGAATEARVSWQPPEPLREPLRQALQQQAPYLPDGFDRAVQLRLNGQDRVYLPRILPIRAPYGGSAGAAVLLEDVTRFRLLDQVKSDLVATASHELKTPLTSIRLAVHLLLEETVGALAPKQAELLVDARDNAERLLAVVNNLLDLARLERGREHLDLRPEAPADILQAAAEAVRPRAEDRKLTVAVEVPHDLPKVAADRQRLGHALGNLLDNALTYTETGGRITLSAAAAGDRVVISVADTGVGIPAEHLPHVFERFFRIPGRSQTGGTGLGLAIVHEIVAAHDGTITCESEPGKGTVFRITLPAWIATGK
jgi:PAS domain S-box-containing protein